MTLANHVITVKRSGSLKRLVFWHAGWYGVLPLSATWVLAYCHTLRAPEFPLNFFTLSYQWFICPSEGGTLSANWVVGGN